MRSAAPALLPVFQDAADRAERTLAMPVNPVIRAASAWQAATDPLLQQIHASPYLIVLEPHDNPAGSGGATNGAARP